MTGSADDGPDWQEEAVKSVLMQEELLCAEWLGAKKSGKHAVPCLSHVHHGYPFDFSFKRGFASERICSECLPGKRLSPRGSPAFVRRLPLPIPAGSSPQRPR